MSKIRVVVMGEDALARRGLCAILGEHPNLEVAGEVASAAEAPATVRRHSPDIVLMEVLAPNARTVSAVTEIAREPDRHARMLLLATVPDEHVLRLLEAGASGFLLRDATPDQLVAAIRVVAAGYSVVAPAANGLGARIIQSAFAAAPDRTVDALTPRELDVLSQIVRGHSNAEIAEQLVLGESTVKFHVQRLLQKLHLRDRVQAVIYAYENHLV